jgi:hypothetical protein
MTVASATVRIRSSRHPVPSAWRAMHSERLVGRPVAIAWNRQPNTSALQRNAAVWRNRQKPSSSSGFWRKWPGLGRNLRRRLIWKTLIRSPDRSASRHRAPVPSATIPVPFVTRRRAILRLGRRSHVQALLSVTAIVVQSPHAGKRPTADLVQRDSASVCSDGPLRAHCGL